MGENSFPVVALRKLLSCVRRLASYPIANSCSAKPSRNWWIVSACSYSIVGLRKLVGCVRFRDNFPSCGTAKTPRTAPCFPLRTHTTFALPNLKATASLLLRRLLNTRYETLLSPERLAGYNDLISRNAALKLQCSQNRRMPHCRLD